MLCTHTIFVIHLFCTHSSLFFKMKSQIDFSVLNVIYIELNIINLLKFAALCKDDANGNVPLGKSCNRYWACQGGYPRLQRCPAMLVFDKLRKRCVAPPTEDCDVPPTTNPPDTEQDERGGNGNGNGNRGGSGNRGGNGNPENRRRLAAQLLNNEPQGNQQQFQLPEGATLIRRPNN